ncbi:MAG: hypothetical protein RIF32_18675 [Leptospirales bacterium]|jgi:hypothetical protein
MFANFVGILKFAFPACPLILLLAVASLPAQDHLSRVPVEIDFGQDVENPNFMTAREIEIRGRSLNLLLMPDHPGRNLQDFRAEGIPASGLEFELRAPGSGRVYLYLDLVSFQPLENAVPRKVRWMEIFVNGHLLQTVHEGGGSFVTAPLVLLIEREHAIDRRLRIRLRPSPGDGFFAIWDAYVSRHAPEPEND